MKRIVWQAYLSLAVGLSIATPSWCAHWKDASLESVASRVVKLYGAGGVQGIEGYQTGLLVSGSAANTPGQIVLTVDGVLLESGEAMVVLSNGDRYTGHVEGIDPLTNVAVLKIETTESLASFDLGQAAPPSAAGNRLRVFSNAFNIAVGDEPVSLQHGVVTARVPLPKARQVPPLLAASPMLLVDCVTSNPGAAGGAVVDLEGRLLGMVGKELRSPSGTWLNYALPTSLLHEAMNRALTPSSKSSIAEQGATSFSTLPQLSKYGIHLIPSVSIRTPAYVEQVQTDSPAAIAGLHRDDLIVLVDGRSVASRDDAQREILSSIAKKDKAQLTVLRGKELLSLELSASVANE